MLGLSLLFSDFGVNYIAFIHAAPYCNYQETKQEKQIKKRLL